MIHMTGVEKRFGAQILFQDLSWMIPAGARLGLVGPNGAGKTTLLRFLAGKDEPDAGTVGRPRLLKVGYLPQEVESFGGGKVLETVLEGAQEASRLETRMRKLEADLAGRAAGDERFQDLTAEYGEALSRYEQIGGDRMESRARRILAGLGVEESCLDDPLDTLSGGWRMRVVLSRLLLGEPDLLLLDEPTNHLDLQAIDWLESFLEEYRGAYVVVSHDRYFLNRMVRAVVELERGKLTVWPGNYDAYLLAREEREELLEKTAKNQAKEIARTERFIERFRYKNTKSKQVQSRVKALEKTERIQTASSMKKIRFGFPPAPRSGDIVVRAEEMGKSYGDLAVFEGMNLTLRRGARVALVGPNGAGKSTLLKLMAGLLEHDRGRFELGHNVERQYFAQHQLEALNPQRTVLEEMEALVPVGMIQKLRNTLGSFLFHGGDVDKKVGVLSGGEKARLALARMLLHPANLLLLDEPTNHLDLRSREVLEEALNEYEGTIVLISHDRYFINRVVDSVAEVGEGKVELYEGDYDTFLQRREHSMEAASSPAARPDPAGAGKGSRRVEAEERNRLYRRRKEIQEKLNPMEKEIATLEQTIRELERSQSDPLLYSDPVQATRIGRDKANAEHRLTTLYAQWERLAAEMP